MPNLAVFKTNLPSGQPQIVKMEIHNPVHAEQFATIKGYTLLGYEATYRINLLEGVEMCCGALCPRKKIQERIDRMQKVINDAHLYFNTNSMNPDKIKDIIQEFKELYTG